jgi:hypothetical protein
MLNLYMQSIVILIQYIISLELVQELIFGLLDYKSFLIDVMGSMLPSQFRHVVTSTVPVLINSCLHYLLCVEVPPFKGVLLQVPINH